MKKVIIVILLLLVSSIPLTTANFGKSDVETMHLVEGAKDYELFGFKDLGVYYTPESLVSFDMPFVVKLKGNSKVNKEDMSSRSSVACKSAKYSYEVIAENKDHQVINYHMDKKAELNFSMDFIPRVKGVEFSEFAWWSSSWYYKVKCNVANAVSDYQMKINLSYDDTLDGGENVTLDSHCQVDFDDIRFTNGVESTLLAYWIETKVDSDYAVVWINTSGDNYIYLYYGNDAVSTTSNGNNVFIGFDDFEDGTLGNCPVDWTCDTTYGTFKIISGKRVELVHITANATGNGNYRSITGITTDNDRIIELEVTPKLASDYSFFEFHDTTIDSARGIYLALRTGQFAYRDGSGWHNLKAFSADTTYKVKIYNIDMTNDQFDIDIDSVNEGTNLNFWNDIATIDHIYIGGGGGENCKNEWDNILVRKYVSPEPSWSSFGGESINDPPVVQNPNPANNSINQALAFSWCVNITDDWTTFNWTIECDNSQTSSANGASNGTKCVVLSGLVCETKYTIWVNATDGNSTTRKIYYFNTIACAGGAFYFNVTFSNENPLNNSVDACLCCEAVCIDVVVNETSSFNLSFDYSFDSVNFTNWLVFKNVTNGSYCFCGDNAILNKTYYWSVNCSNSTNSTLSNVFSFTTAIEINDCRYIKESDTMDINLSLGLGGFMLLIWVFLLYLWHKSESDGMTYLLAMVFIPYDIIFVSIGLPLFNANIWIIDILFIAIALIVGAYTLDTYRKREKK